MKQFLFLFTAVSVLSYGLVFTRAFNLGGIDANALSVPTASPAPNAINTPVPVRPLDFTIARLEAFIRVPSGVVEKPFVILSGYQTYTSEGSIVTLSGSVGDKTFNCPSSPCGVEFPESAQITFRAENNLGKKSDEVQASILVTKVTGGYSVTILTLGKFVTFSDSCANIWQNADSASPFWAKFPQDPAELNTQKTLYYLASRLLETGVVNAKDCPGGGFDNLSPNGCGIERAREQMTIWQNQYDFNIWLTGRDEHIPPYILKTLLEVESQFWPTSQRLFLDELGLGQINQLGIDVLLRTNPALYSQICATSLYRCDQPYEKLAPIDRALIRGALVQSLDAACPTCEYGVNINKAAQSIPLIAKVMYANCVQTKSLLKLNGVKASYEDSWKLTLVSYHSGFGCLQNALAKSAKNRIEVDWDTVSKNLDCRGSAAYVDKFWGSMLSYYTYAKKPPEIPTIKMDFPTPQPSPTPVATNARITVRIFMDQNGDGIQQPGETLDNVQVVLTLENGLNYTAYSKNGTVEFKLSNVSPGLRGVINLPGLYRSAQIKVPTNGDVSLVFVFANPIQATPTP